MHIAEEAVRSENIYIDLLLRRRWRHRLHVGMTAERWVHTPASTHLLTVGPSQSMAGKSASITVNNVIGAHGPVVYVTTKLSDVAPSARVRAHLGQLWHYTADGSPPIPGMHQLRTSPLDACRTPDEADLQARAMIEAAERQRRVSTGNDEFFSARAADLLAGVTYYAAATGCKMRWVYNTIAQGDRDALSQVADELATKFPEAELLASNLEGITRSAARELSGVISTAANALRAFRLSGVLAATEDPNFDADAFVRGDPEELNEHLIPKALRGEWEQITYDTGREPIYEYGLFPTGWGRYDTIYVTASAEHQAQVAPAIVALLTSIRRATFRQAAEVERTGAERPVPVTFVLDELAATAPQDLLSTLADAGGQGLLVCGAIQDLSQAISRWSDAGRGFLSLFQNIVVLPGIRHRETLDVLSEVGGDVDRRMLTDNGGMHWQRARRMPPDMLHDGHPDSPYIAAFYPHGRRPRWVWTSQYWRSSPWRQLIAQCDEYADAHWPELPHPKVER